MTVRLGIVVLTLAAFTRAAAAQAGDSVVFRLSPASRLDVRTGKAGLLGFAGHEHLIRARTFSGRVVYYPRTPLSSHVEIRIAAESLVVLTPPDSAEVRKVTEAMRTEVLHVARYPEITFAARTVAAAEGRLRMIGALTMAGQTREVPVDVDVSIGPDTLRATATFTVKQSDFGIRPYRGGPGGTVRVADIVTFDIAASAVRER